MQVIFCNIPADTTIPELVEFAQSGVKSYLSFLKKNPIVNYDFLDIKDDAEQRKEIHGLVTYATPEDGKRAIKSLNGKMLNGKPVRVKEYLSRSPGDKRINQSTQGLNRPEDRRRKKLEVHKRSEPVQQKAMSAKDSDWVD